MSAGWLMLGVFLLVLAWVDGLRKAPTLHGKPHAWALLLGWSTAPHALAMWNYTSTAGLQLAHILKVGAYAGEYLLALCVLGVAYTFLQVLGDLAAAVQVVFK